MIQDIKDTIASALILGGVTKVYTYLPERPVPPCAMIEPDINFIATREDAYGVFHNSNWKIRLMDHSDASKLYNNYLYIRTLTA